LVFDLWSGLAGLLQYALAMSRARPIDSGTTYLITRRTERRHCLMRPDSKMNRFILYALITAARRHGILLHAFCAMSTHLHYVVTDPLGNLPRFFEMFHSLVARGIKKIREWDGSPWDRAQTSAVALCTREAIVEKIAYTLANPVEAGLVWQAREWPGAKTLVEDIGKNKIHARRPEVCFSPENPEWPLHDKLAVSLPPSIPADEAQGFRDAIAVELANLEKAAHERIPRHKVLGAARVMKIPPEMRITSREPKGQRNPTFAVGRGNTEAAEQAVRALRDFRIAYRKALTEWRSGDRSAVFPAGTYAMRVVHGAKVAIS